MADVMLVLLIIFMVVTPMLQKGVSVELANTVNPVDMKDADRDDAVLVAVTRDGKFYLGQEPIRIEDLATRVNDLLSNTLDKVVYVKSDFRAKYGDVVQVVDNIRNAGVDRVGLLSERLDDQVRR
jgi:biopolymer transport protein ExbD/biopolymer transport protein TolR